MSECDKHKARPGVYHIKFYGESFLYRARKSDEGQWFFADGTGWEDAINDDQELYPVIGPFSDEELSSGKLSRENKEKASGYF